LLVLSCGPNLAVPVSGSERITYDMMHFQETMPSINYSASAAFAMLKKSSPPEYKRGVELLSHPTIYVEEGNSYYVLSYGLNLFWK